MGAFNEIEAQLNCPRCSASILAIIEIKVGNLNQVRYEFGHKIAWRLGKVLKNGGRPKDGNITILGYSVCELCSLDFWVDVVIKNDTIVSVTPNLTEKPYISDGESTC